MFEGFSSQTQHTPRAYCTKPWCPEVHWKCCKKAQCRTPSLPLTVSHLYKCNLLTARTVALPSHPLLQTHCTSVVPTCTWPPKDSFAMKHLVSRSPLEMTQRHFPTPCLPVTSGLRGYNILPASCTLQGHWSLQSRPTSMVPNGTPSIKWSSFKLKHLEWNNETLSPSRIFGIWIPIFPRFSSQAQNATQSDLVVYILSSWLKNKGGYCIEPWCPEVHWKCHKKKHSRTPVKFIHIEAPRGGGGKFSTPNPRLRTWIYLLRSLWSRQQDTTGFRLVGGILCSW